MKIFKNKEQIEPYLLKLDGELRLYLCKFRCGNKKIPKNLALYFNEYGDKICKRCDKNEVGDEFHYIFKCKHFNDDRIKYIDRKYTSGSNIHMMEKLFSNSDPNVSMKLVKFVTIIIKKFE